MAKFEDLTGKKFGELTVLYRNKELQEQKKANYCYWHCLCSCGKETDTTTASLKNGHTKSCGHLAKLTQKQPLKLNPGEIYGRLTILERVPAPKSRNSIWKCKCECGNIINVTGHCLKSGMTKSCGCLQEENRHKLAKNITGEKFGLLTAIKPLNRDKGKTFNWLCKCDCGNECIVSLDYLQQKTRVSCGCKKISMGEQKIKDILEKNHIQYEYQKVFSNCRFPETNHLLYFDFYLPQYNTVIEFDGQQHFTFTNSGWNTEENYIVTHKRDLFKNQWCKDNHITLKRIPYTEIKNITFTTIMSNTYIMKEEYYDK